MGVDREARSRAFRAVARTQPGCTPYDNHRPIHVRKHSAGQTLASLLSTVRPYSRDAALMATHRDAGLLTVDHKKPSLAQVLVAGNIIRMVVPDTVEPPISPDLVVLHEDVDILVVNKPAPLPVHPGGRFNRNTLVWLGREAWPDVTLKPVHRLDASTTGVLVMGKSADAARALVAEFRERRVDKYYLARVRGAPPADVFHVDAPIASAPSLAGMRTVTAEGRAAHTEIRLLRSLPDGTSILEAMPSTGRTHQIRLHLHSVGLSIVGDNAYSGHSDVNGGFTRADQPIGLHAWRIRFRHPTTGRPVEFEAPLPPSFECEERIDD